MNKGKMKEEFGDFWSIEGDLRCITTNGALRKNGSAVMGRGIALQAKLKYPDIEKTLGRLIKIYGNHVFYLGHGLASFPTKHHWMDDKSDIELIKNSCEELISLLKGDIPVKKKEERRILLPRPGCGTGNLKWDEVKSVIEKILVSDEFIIVDRCED